MSLRRVLSRGPSLAPCARRPSHRHRRGFVSLPILASAVFRAFLSLTRRALSPLHPPHTDRPSVSISRCSGQPLRVAFPRQPPKRQCPPILRGGGGAFPMGAKLPRSPSAGPACARSRLSGRSRGDPSSRCGGSRPPSDRAAVLTEDRVAEARGAALAPALLRRGGWMAPARPPPSIVSHPPCLRRCAMQWPPAPLLAPDQGGESVVRPF